MTKSGRPPVHDKPDKVFTVRLNEEIQTEAVALSVMEEWKKQDPRVTPRHMFTQALIALADYVPPETQKQPEIDLMQFIEVFQEEIGELRKAIKELRSSGIRVDTKAADAVASTIQANLPKAYLKNLAGRINKGENE